MSEAEVVLGEVLVEEAEPGVWVGVQVVGLQGRDAVVAALDWLGSSRPGSAPAVSADEVAARGVLIPNHNAHDGTKPLVTRVRGRRAHWRLRSVGVADPLVAPAPSSAGPWADRALARWHQYRWDLLPDELRRQHGGAERRVEVDLGDGVQSVGSNARFVRLGPAVDLASLDQLPWITGVEVAGAPPGLEAWLRRRPTLSELRWISPPATVDVTGTSMRRLILEGSIEQLTGCTGNLSLIGDGPVPRLIGTPRRVTLTRTNTDIAELVHAMPEVSDLWIHGDGAGRVERADHFPELTQLRSLQISECYWFEPDGLRSLLAMAALHSLDLHDVPRTIANGLKQALGTNDGRLTATRLRSDPWIRDNGFNPFRKWIDDNARFGKRATALWKRFSKDVDELPTTASPDDLQTIVDSFVEELNALDNTSGGLIDTLRRDEACAAICSFARRQPGLATEADIARWVDARRSW